MGENIKINGVSLSSMGVSLLHGGYSALLEFAPLKEYVTNDDPMKAGIQIDLTHVPPVASRDVTLTFLIVGGSESAFLANLSSFKNAITQGIVELDVPDLGCKYRLLYKNSTQFENYRLNACKLSVKFNEPDPTNRQYNSSE